MRSRKVPVSRLIENCPTTRATPRFTFDPNSFTIFLDVPPALVRPVLKSSNCLEQRIHALFAAHPSEEYSLQYPGRISAWGGAVPLGGPMWGNKKPYTPQAAQPVPKNLQTNQPPKPAPATWEDKPAMSTDAMRPLGATADRAEERLRASLHVKGEISGNEDLLIDGSF